MALKALTGAESGEGGQGAAAARPPPVVVASLLLEVVRETHPSVLPRWLAAAPSVKLAAQAEIISDGPVPPGKAAEVIRSSHACGFEISVWIKACGTCVSGPKACSQWLVSNKVDQDVLIEADSWVIVFLAELEGWQRVLRELRGRAEAAARVVQEGWPETLGLLDALLPPLISTASRECRPRLP